MQILDVLSAFILMDMPREFKEARKFVQALDFTSASTKVQVSVFELMIRGVGGLLSAYSMSYEEDTLFLTKAEQLLYESIIFFLNYLCGSDCCFLSISGLFSCTE